MMEDIALTAWHWAILGIVLCTLEVLLPGVYLIWIGVAALIVAGVVGLLSGLSVPLQLIVFAVIAVVNIVMIRAYQKRHPIKSDEPVLNQRGRQYIGQSYTLTEPIINGIGRIRINDTLWKISGTDLPIGARVTVTGIEGAVLITVPVDPDLDN